MIQQMKEESDNPGKQNGNYGIIDDYAKENWMEDDEDFDGFQENKDVTSKADWRTMGILMGF